MKTTLKVLGAFLIAFFIGAFLRTAYGAPTSRQERTLLPETTLTYDLGSASKVWNQIFGGTGTFTNMTVTGTCTGCGGGAGGSGNVATSTTETSGFLAYFTSTGGTPAKLGQVATSSLAVTAPITFSGTLGSQVGGVLGSFGCTAASAGVTGCLSGTDWSTFNNKQATIGVTYPIKLSGATISTDLASTTIAQTYGTNQIGAITFATSSDTNLGLNITNTAGAFTFTPSWIGTLANSRLTNSTISGVALGSSLGALTATNASLTFSGSYDGSTARTVGLNVGNANTFTALEQFNANASTTQLSVYNKAYFGASATSTFDSAGILTLITPLAAGSGGTGLNALGTGVATFLGTPSSANLASALTDETGTLKSVFSDAPTFTTNITSPLVLGTSYTGTSTFPHASTTDLRVNGNLDLWNTVSTSFANFITNIRTTLDAVYCLVSGCTPTGVWDFGGATSLEIPNGSAPTVDATGETAVDTTSDQFVFFGGTAKKVLGNGNFYPAFTYATSTAFSGTTTIPLGTAYVGETWNGVQCFTDAGTLNVSFYDGTNRMNLFNASTTVGTVTLSTNNTFTASEKRYVDIGTPASSPTKIACTVSKSLTSD